MPLNPPRVLIVRAHALEIFISVVAITLGIFVWLSMKDSNSGVNLLVGAALLVAGVILFASAMRTILKYKTRRYSIRSACMGDIEVARLAGIMAAKNEQTASPLAATASASGSQEETP